LREQTGSDMSCSTFCARHTSVTSCTRCTCNPQRFRRYYNNRSIGLYISQQRYTLNY